MRTVGIIGAMESEVTDLIAHLGSPAPQEIAGRRFYEGTIGGCPAVVVQSGIGKVAAGVTAQLLIDRFGADVLINTGMAGGLDPRLEVKDLVIAADAVQHDFDMTAWGYAPGYMRGDDQKAPTAYPCDPALAALAQEAARQVLPAGVKALTGRVVSGDVFVADEDRKRYLLEQFGGTVAEMEGAAIAQVAADNGVPCLILRTVSDLAGRDAEISFNELEAYVGTLAGNITAALLKRMASV